ncbi:xyloglucan galactosyltransferase XLT2-like [Primulina eburnea]|uniref:xyloglucan galactosyltransferase XLT2-like n=1 Tax=Primulina eburnea TaxID=1245227 RepID=UPI003C6C4895
MLPSFGKQSPAAAVEEEQQHQRHLRLKSKFPEIKTAADSVKYFVSSYHCAWLTAAILLQIVTISFFVNRASIPSPVYTALPLAQARHDNDDVCEFGRIYVYHMPSLFNQDLLDNCHELAPWSSRCTALSNNGFGPPAAELSGVIPYNLTPAWYWTDLYAGEPIFHHRMMSYKCRTMYEEEATAFYIPFYVGLAVGKHLWSNYKSEDRDFHSLAMLNWIKNQSPWKKSNGSDHFIMMGRLTWDFRRLSDNDNEWGSRFLYMPLMKNVLHLTVERSPWDPLEISVPYPTPFHPRSESDIDSWQNFIRARTRSNLFSFVGGTRKTFKKDFRGLLMSLCRNDSSSCKLVDCSITPCYDGALGMTEAFLDSVFCLQPKGDGFTRRSAFDCMLAGAIPVYFWRGSFENQYEWFLPVEAKTYSVFIDNNLVRNRSSIIKDVLEKYNTEEVETMREKIIEFMPRFLYSKSNANLGRFKDAFDITMDEVLARFKQQKDGVKA